VADQKKWFKVWTTLLIDSLSTKIDDIGRFAVLGCLIATRGENGKLVTDKKTLQTLLQCKEISPEFTKMFNVIIEEIGDTCNGNISVTLKNWHKYQVDTTGYERQQRYREAHSVTEKVTAQDKIRLDKIRKEKKRIFIPPTIEEVNTYCKERKNQISANAFIDHYESKGWFIGKNKMNDWRAAVRTWENKKKEGEYL